MKIKIWNLKKKKKDATLNKFKKQILYLQQQIEQCLHELYPLAVKLKQWINHHLNSLNKEEENYEIQNKLLVL